MSESSEHPDWIEIVAGIIAKGGDPKMVAQDALDAVLPSIHAYRFARFGELIKEEQEKPENYHEGERSGISIARIFENALDRIKAESNLPDEGSFATGT